MITATDYFCFKNTKGNLMKVRLFLAISLLAVTSLWMQRSNLKASTPQQAEVTAHPQIDANDKTYPMDQIVTATVHDAWLLSGKNEEAFFDIVEQLAQFSAQKRGLVLPNTAAAGRQMGVLIKTRAKADRDQLLYAVVDQAVRTLGQKPSVSAK
jgi:hypothetical protein